MDVFICHASEDKDVVVRPIADALRKQGIEVWYDECTLQLGDNIRRKIEDGLLRCRFGVVVLSPHFFQKEWPQFELDGLVTREIGGKTKVILPVWHNVSDVEIARHSPTLAAKLAVSTSLGIDVVVAQIVEVLRPDQAPYPGIPTAPLDGYEIIHPIFHGHYSRVLKCRIPATGEVCVVKETQTERVCLEALRALENLKGENVAAPRKIWEGNGKVYEELPYVGGTRLSDAVLPKIGGLTGSVLESFCHQMTRILSSLHGRKIIHRDIHPDNIYLVIKPKPSNPSRGAKTPKAPWGVSYFGSHANEFSLAWVVVDCTFSTLESQSQNSRYQHGPYTSEEQLLGAATQASDLYAYGATLYFGITGQDIPSFRRRRENPHLLDTYPSGGHPSVDFPDYLASLLSLDPCERPNSMYLRESTVGNGHTGTLRISDTVFLIADYLENETRLLSGEEALSFFRKMRRTWDATGRTPGEAEYFRQRRLEAECCIERLEGAGVED